MVNPKNKNWGKLWDDPSPEFQRDHVPVGFSRSDAFSGIVVMGRLWEALEPQFILHGTSPAPDPESNQPCTRADCTVKWERYLKQKTMICLPSLILSQKEHMKCCWVPGFKVLMIISDSRMKLGNQVVLDDGCFGYMWLFENTAAKRDWALEVSLKVWSFPEEMYFLLCKESMEVAGTWTVSTDNEECRT